MNWADFVRSAIEEENSGGNEMGDTEKALEIREKVRRGEERVMNILYAAPDVPVSHMDEFCFFVDNISIYHINIRIPQEVR